MSIETGSVPRSAYDQAGGMAYFPRMLSKIRLHAEGRLRSDFHANLGKNADGWCIGFLRIDYASLSERVLEGGSDEEILQWCFEKGRRLDSNDLWIWNQFITKVGWNDPAAKRLDHVKQESGLGHRTDIVTMMEFFDVDEGRKK